MQEADLAVLLEGYFESRGSPGSSFLQAASGPNSTNVHFGAGERVLEDGDIIVFDVGAWWNDYTADISRTVPVSGRFTKEQREIYTVVLNSQKAAIELMVPGATMDAVRERAQDVLIDGLHELGLVLDKRTRPNDASSSPTATTISSAWTSTTSGPSSAGCRGRRSTNPA